MYTVDYHDLYLRVAIKVLTMMSQESRGGGITLEMALALCNRMNRGYKYFDKPPSTEAEGSISQVGGISCGTPLYLILCRSRVHT